MKTPDCTIVIPTYNGARFLREALESVFAQSWPPQEIIVVDDASTDGTPDLVEAIAKESGHSIRLIRLPVNSGGPARPINVGIGAASGDLIAVLDQDDVLESSAIETKAAALVRHPGASFAFTWCGDLANRERIVQPQERRDGLIAAAIRQQEDHVIPQNVALRMLILHGCFVVGFPGFMFRRSDWQKKGGGDESLSICGDYDLLLWLSCQGDAALVPRVGYWRREHGHNATRQRVAMLWEADRLRVRYLRASPALQQDAELSECVAREFFGQAYWLREGGYYREAFNTLRLALSLRRLRGQLLLGMLKLPVHWAYSKLLGKSPVLSSYTSPDATVAPN